MYSWSFEFVWAFIALPFLLYCLYRCKITVNPRYFPNLHFFGRVGKWRHLESILKALTVSAMVAALAMPAMIDYADPRNRNGIDIVLAIDASGSMNASGFVAEGDRTSRFEAVQKIASDFIRKRLQDNVGVVVFGDFAFIASPVTYEKAIVSEMIGYLSHGMAGQNTAIGEGVAKSVRALEGSKAASKAIILLTDGEHNSGAISPQAAMQMVRQNHIRLYTIGIGENGEFDSALLRQMAHDGGGAFLSAQSAQELEAVYDEIERMEKSRIKSEQQTFPDHYFQWLITVALMLSGYLLIRKWRAG